MQHVHLSFLSADILYFESVCRKEMCVWHCTPEDTQIKTLTLNFKANMNEKPFKVRREKEKDV